MSSTPPASRPLPPAPDGSVHLPPSPAPGGFAPSSPSTARRAGRLFARAIGVAVALGWGLLLAAWLALHWVILPHIQQWRGSIETRASRVLGVPVRIGDIEVRSSGWMPTIELREVSLLGADGLPALRLPRVVAALSARSLLALEVDFEQLSIEGAELDVQRDAAGRLLVAGLGFDGGGASTGGGGAVDWFFRQREFVIRGGAVRWTDALRPAPPLTLANVDFVVRNGLREHSLRLDATPPPAWGARFSVVGRFTQPLLARRGDWQRWSGSVYAALPRADVHALRQYLALPFELSEGIGALRGWFEVRHGEAVGATLDLALRDLALRLAPEVDVLRFAEVQGRVIGARDKDGVTLEAQRFGFVTGDGVRWPAGGLKFAWRQREGQPPAGGSFHAERLDLALMAQIASRIPLGDAASKLLDELHPQGIASPIEVRWDGRASAPTHYRVSGRLGGLSLAARPAAEAEALGRPGVHRANLQFDASDTGGIASVDLAHGALDLPGVFEDPLLTFDRFAARLAWKIEPVRGPLTGQAAAPPPRITLQVDDARFANADAHVDVTARWVTGDGVGTARGGRFPGRLELDAKVGDVVATRIHRYLPLGLSRGMRDYAQRALQGGRVPSASVRVRGDLWDFPFFNAPRVGDRTHRSEGQFRIAGKVDDVTFAYVPEPPGAAPGTVPYWPKLTAASGEWLIDRNLLEIRGGRARIGAVELDQIGGRIEHLENDAGLTLDARARGPLTDMLRFVDDSPIGGWIGKVLAAASATGTAELKAGIGVPLAHPDTGSSVRGSLTLAGNELRFTPATPVLVNARGRVDFTQQGFTLVGTGARVYGGDAIFQGGTDRDGSVRLTGQGNASAEGLQQATELGPLARLAASFTGQTGYRVGLAFPHGQPEISVTSNLVGLAINLPAPLAKAAETSLPMRYQTGPEIGAGEVPLESIQIDLGNVLQTRFVREAGSASGRVLRGGIGVMAPAPSSASGVAATLDVKSLDVDAWQAVAARVFPAETPGAAAGPGTGSAAVGGGFEPDRVALRAQTLDAGTRRLTRVTAGLTREGALWRATVDADQLAGYVEARLPGSRGPNAGGRLYARLSRLSLPKSEAEQVSTLLDSRPASIPALDVVVDDFELRGTRLGRLEIEATNRFAAPRRDPQRDWQLNRLAITTPEASFTGSGLWAAAGTPAGGSAGAGRRMAIDFQLQLADGGALLDRLGTRNAVRGGKGKLAGQVAWVGTPFAIDYPSLAGQVNVAIDAGQFLKAEPGAARLLGVLSLQSLPRRLTLDFRDVFAEGFAFDNVTGDLTIAQGVAETHNLRMRGVQATVLMEGSADIERETQNLHVVVVPEINAGTAALAYAAINPAIGLGAFLAQWVLRKPLMAAGTREFEVTGAWADPKVAPVAGTPPAATSAASAPPRNP